MAGIVEGLFGQTPLEIRQHQEAIQRQRAQQYGAQDPMAAVRQSQYGVGAQIGNMVNRAMGQISPEEAQAKQAQEIQSQIDTTTPEGLMRGAQMFNQVGNPQMAQRLVQAARELQKQISDEMLVKSRAAKEDAMAEKYAAWQQTEMDKLSNKSNIAEMNIAGRENVAGMNIAGREKTTGMNNATSLATTGMNVDSRRDVANIGANSRRDVANIGANSRKEVAGLNNGARGEKLTQGQNAVDRAFAKELVPFMAAGGAAGAESQLKVLEGVRSELLEKGNNYTGSGKALIPDYVRSATNEKALAAENKVYGIIQTNLKPVLGAQFTQKEGENLLKRAYNPNLSPQANAESLKVLVKQVRAVAKAKAEAATYFKKYGTLAGWDGEIPSYNDVYNSLPSNSTTSEKQPSTNKPKFLGYE
jgi:hypothetical protein